ncbi:MAG: hypothetical protein U0610_23860 [bacterium]
MPNGSDDKPWDVRILELIDSGIDVTLIDENLRRTPSERLERMQRMVRFLEEAKGDRDTAPR